MDDFVTFSPDLLAYVCLKIRQNRKVWHSYYKNNLVQLFLPHMVQTDRQIQWNNHLLNWYTYNTVTHHNTGWN